MDTRIAIRVGNHRKRGNGPIIFPTYDAKPGPVITYQATPEMIAEIEERCRKKYGDPPANKGRKRKKGAEMAMSAWPKSKKGKAIREKLRRNT
jgi:hypothetical protein